MTTDTTTATTSNRMSDTTWDTIGHQLTRRDGYRLGWTDRHNLEADLADALGWTRKQAEAMVSGCASALPVRLVWDRPAGEGRIERIDTVVHMDSLVFWGATSTSNRVRVSYLGFAHDLYLSQVRFAELVWARVTFHAEGDAPAIMSNNPPRD